MLTFIRWIFGIPLAVFITAFAVFNRQNVEVFWSPINEPVNIPLYFIGLGLMAFGFIIGGIIVWLNQGSLRSAKRKQNKQIKTLEKELKNASENIKDGTPPSDFFPALPGK